MRAGPALLGDQGRRLEEVVVTEKPATAWCKHSRRVEASGTPQWSTPLSEGTRRRLNASMAAVIAEWSVWAELGGGVGTFLLLVILALVVPMLYSVLPEGIRGFISEHFAAIFFGAIILALIYENS